MTITITDEATCALCDDPLGDDYTPNVEAYKLTGDLICDFCAEDVVLDHSQFGVGA